MSIPIHFSTEGTPGDRGLAFGRARRDQVANTVDAYHRLFSSALGLSLDEVRRAGHVVGEAVSTRWPDLAEEISGIAHGARQDADDLFAVNARTELLGSASPPECSVVSVSPEPGSAGHLLLAQNWDWHPTLAASRILWSIAEPSGHWLATLTEAGILAKIGLNDRGVGCCLNILLNSADGGLEGAPIHVLLRLVLEECDGLREALDLLASAHVAASSCITLGDAGEHGGAVSVELSPGGACAVHPDAQGRLAHTNHFLVASPMGEDAYGEMQESIARYQELRLSLGRSRHPLAIEDIGAMLRLHDTAPLGVCRHIPPDTPFVLRSGTLASVIMDLTERRMLVADGNPCETEYEEVPLPAWTGVVDSRGVQAL